MLSDLNASCSRSALHWCIVGKVSWTAEVHHQIEFVVVVLLWLYAPEFIPVLPERITDTITEQAIYSAVQLWGELTRTSASYTPDYFYRYAPIISHDGWWLNNKRGAKDAGFSKRQKVVIKVPGKLYFSFLFFCPFLFLRSQALMMFNWTHLHWQWKLICLSHGRLSPPSNSWR